MEMQIQVFESGDFGQIRIVDNNGEPWFVATDVARALGYGKPNNAIKMHCKKVNKISYGESQYVLNIIPQSDVYRLIMRSRLANEELKEIILKQISNYHIIMDALKKFEIPEDIPDMFVYAIMEEDTNNIKIGISKNPEARLKQLQTGNSSKLRLIGMRKAENKFKDEKALHQKNESYKIHGEWFSNEAKNTIVI